MSDNSNDVSVGGLDTLRTAHNIDQLNLLSDTFRQHFHTEPTFYVRVPGRVNLIGEHVDYCGYPVFPMAIEQSIILAVAPSTDAHLHIANVNSNYKPFECHIEDISIEVPGNGVAPEWYNYFLCGVKGIFDELKDGEKVGLLAAVSGTIPPAAGLSSSSALVSSAALATSFINRFSLDKATMADISAKCERFIGTQGGGMDQAIAYLAREGCAQLIEWEPLKATPTTLPSSAHFVIANSLTKANKAATHDYNQRVIECRLACRILAKQAHLRWTEFERFATLQRQLDIGLREFEAFAERLLTQDVYTREDIIKLLDVDENDFEAKLLTPNTRHLEKFKLRQRALHVIQEALRVADFHEFAMRSDNIDELGKLMRESHRSLDEKYECSHANLNKLIEISDQHGVAARLTGAGWGGCIVAICDSRDKCNRYIAALKENYFKLLPDYDERESHNVIFVTNPQAGAAIHLNEHA